MRQRDFCRRDVHFFQHNIQHLIPGLYPGMDYSSPCGGCYIVPETLLAGCTLRLGKSGDTPISPTSCNDEYPSRQYPDFSSLSMSEWQLKQVYGSVLVSPDKADDATIFKPVFKATSRSEASRPMDSDRGVTSSCRGHKVIDFKDNIINLSFRSMLSAQQ